jgi:hypothetical protein
MAKELKKLIRAKKNSENLPFTIHTLTKLGTGNGDIVSVSFFKNKLYSTNKMACYKFYKLIF